MKIKQRLRNWLELDFDKQFKKKETELEAWYKEKLDKELKLWTGLFKNYSEIECSNCHKLVITYPLGGGYHRLWDGTVLCTDCGAKHSKHQLVNK